MDRISHDLLGANQLDELGSQRGSARDSLLLTARFRVAGGAEEVVRVRNLSAGGLMAEHARPLTQGTVVEVEIRGIGWVSGHIAWCAEGRVGVAFDWEIDPKKARRPVGTGGQTPGYAKPVSGKPPTR